MPEMISLQTFTLRSLTGHTRAVKARIPIDIPEVCVEEAMARGMVPVHEAGIPIEHSSNPRPKAAAPQGKERGLKILRKIEEFVTRSKTEVGLFTGSGAPNAKLMGQELGFQITTKERNNFWHQYRQEGVPEAPTVMTIEQITATSKRGGASSEGVVSASAAPATIDTEDLSLDSVLEQTGLEDNTDSAFSSPPKDD